ncbi:Phage-related lysozyme (muraminidase) [Achromobacter xylosoxidans]|nr:Phage-related lysozyme (muraminidase) [Achromobacter xylosoxidans]
MDPIGIVTACSGHTKTAVLGRPYSPEECRRLLEADLVDHAEGVLAGHQYQLAAATSFAFNVGVGAYCRSATARRFNAGDLAGACRAMNQADNGKPQWVWVGGQMLPGLVKRRAIEREMFVAELEGFKTEAERLTGLSGGIQALIDQLAATRPQVIERYTREIVQRPFPADCVRDPGRVRATNDGIDAANAARQSQRPVPAGPAR